MAVGEREAISTWSAAASTAIADLIAGPVRPAEVIADFPVARYLAADGAVIALLTPAAVRLPNGLVCRALPPAGHDHEAGSGHGGSAVVGEGFVRLGRSRVRVGRWWDPVVRLPHVEDVPELGQALGDMRALLSEWPAPDEPAGRQLDAGRGTLADALAGAGTPAAAADQLVGLGSGLTPAGDDLLAGAVAGLVIFGGALGGRGALDLAEEVARAIGDRRARTTVLAADLARHAASGAVAEPVGAVCRALAGGYALEPALRRLLAIGHTSGRDLAEGLLMGTTAALTIR